MNQIHLKSKDEIFCCCSRCSTQQVCECTCGSFLQSEGLKLWRADVALALGYGRVQLQDLDALVQAGRSDSSLSCFCLGLPVGDLGGKLHF